MLHGTTLPADFDDARRPLHNRELDPTLGRWTRQDPAGYADASNRYVYEQSAPIQNGDPSGLITVIRVKGNNFADPKAGERVGMEWNFMLDSPAGEDGYLVQKITIEVSSATCEECKKGNTGNSTGPVTYWEAWPVKKGSKVTTAPKSKYTDTANYQVPGSGCGTISQSGDIKFFPKTVTGDLKWESQGTYGSGIGATSSGTVPSTGSEPSWWGTESSDPASTRSFTLQWNFCDKCPAGGKKGANPSATPTEGGPDGKIK